MEQRLVTVVVDKTLCEVMDRGAGRSSVGREGTSRSKLRIIPGRANRCPSSVMPLPLGVWLTRLGHSAVLRVRHCSPLWLVSLGTQPREGLAAWTL